MTPRRRLLFAALVLAQALVPLVIIGGNELALARGTEVRLRTVPIDPVDLFRGRYVVLRYEISRLPAVYPARRGDTVYVELEEQDGAWTGTLAVPERPESRPFIRGRVTRVHGDEVDVEYGIETYFADEAEARRLEREAGRRLRVDVVLDRDGRARIEGVELVG